MDAMANLGTPGVSIGEKLAFSIKEFCTLHGISRAHFYNLRNLGLGPREMDVRGRRVISVEAAKEWRRQREAAAEPRVPRTNALEGKRHCSVKSSARIHP